MSVDLYVFLERRKLPAAKQLNAAFDSVGLNLRIQSDDNWGNSGVTVERKNNDGEWADFSFLPIDDNFKEMAAEAGKTAASCDLVAEFSFHRDEELAIAMPTALLLAQISDGIFYDPQEGEYFCGAKLKKHITKLKDEDWGIM